MLRDITRLPEGPEKDLLRSQICERLVALNELLGRAEFGPITEDQKRLAQTPLRIDFVGRGKSST